MRTEFREIHRILIATNSKIEVNMVYAEIPDNDREVFGSFSGRSGGGGFFHQDEDGEIAVSDDPGEFYTKIPINKIENIYCDLDRLRCEFEKYNDTGDSVGLSEKGAVFLKKGGADINGYSESYSANASCDFIYDVQEYWNLNFRIEAR